MSNVWVCVPSKRPPAEVEKWAQAWRDMGYRLALWRDWETVEGELSLWPFANLCDHISAPRLRAGDDFDGYPGYAVATNALIQRVINERAAQWCVIGGDDVWPDTTKRADEIAQECEAHFDNILGDPTRPFHVTPTFGVMQPTGQRWGDKNGAYVDRVCGSAWLGREFCLSFKDGQGPLWPKFTHMYADECLQNVATRLGVLWQRPDLTHDHRHWGRPREGETMGMRDRMPEFLKKWNTDEHWRESKAEFERLKVEDFASCMPTP